MTYIEGINKEGEKVYISLFTDVVRVEEVREVRKYAQAFSRNLVEIEIPDFLYHLTCFDNPIKELWIPKSLKELTCDKGVILKGDWNRSDLRITMY